MLVVADRFSYARPTVIRRFLPAGSSLSCFVFKMRLWRDWRPAAADPAFLTSLFSKFAQKFYGVVFHLDQLAVNLLSGNKSVQSITFQTSLAGLRRTNGHPNMLSAHMALILLKCECVIVNSL